MMTQEGCIFGMGNPLLDIVVTVDEQFLAKYDLKSNDAILADEKHMPIYDEVSQRNEAEYLPGGATLNAIKVSAWVLGKPESGSFVGCIANDKRGKILEESCTKLGVHPALQYTTSAEPTGTCAVLVKDQDRSLVTSLGAANKFTVDHLDNPEVWKWVQMSKIAYIGGFFLTVCPPAIMKVAKHTLESGTIFSMNLSAPFLCEFFHEPLFEAMPYIDLLFGNESEAQALASTKKWDCATVADVAVRVAALPMKEGKKERMVIFTQGADPVIVVQNGKVTEFPVVPMKEEQIVDTNGAGDAFVGGFLAQFVQGKSIKDAVRCGVYAAREVIQRSGCTTPAKCSFV